MKNIIFLAVIIVFCSCKKDRLCECTNSNGTYVAGEIKATEKKAKKHCESLSTANTKCYLK